MGNQLFRSYSGLEPSLTLRENSVFGSYDDTYTAKYFCVDGKCNFESALFDIAQKYPELSPIVKQIDENQDTVCANQVKNIILHDIFHHIVVLHHETAENHKLNAFINVNFFK